MPSRRLGKIAMQCSREEVLDEVWAQLQDHLEDLDRGNVVLAFLDPAIEFPNPTQAANLEPLLVNTAGSWADRPDAVTRIPNLFLASDYVRTHTDLATMEGANEAARRAVNGILDGERLAGAAVRDLAAARAGGVRRPRKALDRLRWRLFRRPAKPPLRVTEDGGVRAGRPGGRAGWCGSARCSGVCAAEPGERAAALELLEPERLDRPERAGALDPPAARRRAPPRR